MTDYFDRDQAKYWFDQSCRYAELVGHIAGWATAAERVRPEESLAQIRRLLEEFETRRRDDQAGE